jgi:hypothetical protein
MSNLSRLYRPDSLFYVQVAAGFYEPGVADRKMGVRLVRERPTFPTYIYTSPSSKQNHPQLDFLEKI